MRARGPGQLSPPRCSIDGAPPSAPITHSLCLLFVCSLNTRMVRSTQLTWCCTGRQGRRCRRPAFTCSPLREPSRERDRARLRCGLVIPLPDGSAVLLVMGAEVQAVAGAQRVLQACVSAEDGRLLVVLHLLDNVDDRDRFGGPVIGRLPPAWRVEFAMLLLLLFGRLVNFNVLPLVVEPPTVRDRVLEVAGICSPGFGGRRGTCNDALA